MESARAPGIMDSTSVEALDEDYSPLIDGCGAFVDLSTLSGDHGQPRLQTEDLYGDDLIGVSMSRVQTQMRSPGTPAAEKARALNLPVDYFRRVLNLAEELDQDSDTDQANEVHTDTPDDNLRPPALFQHNAERSASPEPIEKTSSSRKSASSNSQGQYYDQAADQSALAFERTYHDQIQLELDYWPAFQPWESPLPSQPTRQPPTPPAGNHIPQRPRQSENDSPHLDSAQDNTQALHPQRQSITKSLLSGSSSTRSRSLSGPTTLFANLRKLLPDLPLSHSARSSTSVLPSSSTNSGQQTPSGSDTPTSRSFRWSLREPVQKRGTAESAQSIHSEHASFHDLTIVSSSQLDGNVESLLSPTSPASNTSRARSNSEGSLFIRRRVSGASSYDDISAFSHVTDLTNSRFKAITDSFQNSTIKLPRMPAILPGAKRRPDQLNGEIAREAGHPSATTDGRVHNHQYSSVKKLRHAAKGLEIDEAQQRAHPVLTHALSKAEGDVVVLGGYRGSILRSAKPPHRQLWVPFKVGLNLRKVDLEVGLTRKDEERMEHTIIPDGALSHIGPIDICRRLLKHMRKCPNSRDNKLRVHNWGYDWRLSPDFLSDKLIKFLESLDCNHPETPPERRGAIVVAHSLGGLITRHAVNQRPDLFAGVVFAGTPQHCVNILGPLRNGDDVLLSSRVLTAQVNFTIRTSFVLLPEDGRCFIEKHTNKRYDLDFFNSQTWEDFHLSPCINPALDHRIKDNKDDRRKSIMDHISDSISTSAKRGSWFGGAPSQGQSSQIADVGESLDEASQRGSEIAQDIEGNAEGVVGPSMTQTHHRPTVATAVTIPKDLAKEYLDRTLAEVLVFKQELKFNPSHHENNVYPPHAFIFGKTVPTVYGARVANEEAIKYNDAFDDVAFAAGDGVVLASAAQLPDGYPCVKGGRVESDRGHVGLMGDLEGMGRCIGAVIDARSKGVGLGRGYAR